MRSVGITEAKRQWAQLLDDVAKGETITITKHGVPVAELRPLKSSQRRDVTEAIDEMKKLRAQIGSLNGVTIRELIEEGRRY